MLDAPPVNFHGYRDFALFRVVLRTGARADSSTIMATLPSKELRV